LNPVISLRTLKFYDIGRALTTLDTYLRVTK